MDEVAALAEKAGRSSEGIRVVAVSKYAELGQMEAIYEAGCRDFGENRLPIAQDKAASFHPEVRWHFVGALQRKKVPSLKKSSFDLLQSVDSFALAEKLSHSYEDTIPQKILLQCNVSGEPQKRGLQPHEWEEIYPKLQDLPGIHVEGLMTMAPNTDDQRLIARCFAALRTLGEKLAVRELSMGMTNDYPIAIAEGATILRIGSKIFA